MCHWCCRWMVVALLVVPLLAVHGAAGQGIPAKGTAATFDVATWNIEMFGGAGGPGDDALQRANVRAVIEQADIDLWGVQEIADPGDFDVLLAELGGGYDGVLATESSGLRMGFIYKTDVVRNVVARHILTGFNAAFAGRPPLLMAADVALPDTTLRLTFIVLHMKAFGDQASYDQRVEAAGRLKSHLDILRPGDPIVILGDFNDELGGSIAPGHPSPYQPFLDDPAGYAFLTLPLDQQNTGTFCNDDVACAGGATLDHLLITNELFAAYQAGSAARFDELLDAFDGTGGACGGEYACTTSDHLPVFARFRLATGTAVEAADVPEAALVEAAYPNPFRERTTLAYTLSHPADVRLDVFDVLGRRVARPAAGFQPAGTHRAAFDARALPPGLYLVRLTAGDVVHVRRVVRMR